MFRSTLCVAAILIFVGNAASNDPSSKNDELDFSKLEPLVRGIKKAAKVSLYEGLPHPEVDPDVFERERKKRRTIERHDFLFYEEALPLKEEDGRTLTELFCDPDSFIKYGGLKFCGRFHPDYLVEWRDGDNVYQAQLCLGCVEMRCFGPKEQVLCDIDRDAYKLFLKVLREYRKNNPKPHPDLLDRPKE